MAIKMGLKATGIDAALAEIAELTPATKRAATRAQNKVAVFAGARGARLLAKANRLPVKVIRDRTRIYRAKPNREWANVWIGAWPIPAERAGPIRETRNGAAAGRWIYPDYFVATMPKTGHTGVFIRTVNYQPKLSKNSGVVKGSSGSKRWTDGRPSTSSQNLPIERAVIDLQELEETRADMAREGEARYRKILIEELNFELNVKGR